jgi:hypothetical protein
MFRRCAGVLLVLSMASLWIAQAEEPAPSGKPGATKPGATSAPSAEQVVIASRYRQLEETLLRIAQKMEKRGPEDRNKARLIYRALREAKDKGIAVSLNELAEDLKKPALKDLTAAIAKGTAVEEDLKRLLNILLSDEQDDSKKNEIDFLKDMVKNLEAAIRAESTAIAQNSSSNVDKDTSKKAQEVANKQIEELLAKIKKYEDAKKGDKANQQKPNDGKPNDGKPNDGKPMDGKPMDGKPNDGKPNDGKPMDGKPNDGKPNDGKPMDGKPMDGKPNDKKPMDGKPEDKKPNDGKPEDKKPMDGKPMDGKPMDGKPSDGKPMDGKPMDGKPMDGKPMDGKPSDGKPSDPMEGEEQEKGVPGREKIKDAEDLAKKASDKIDKDKRNEAGDDQRAAKEKLEQAKKRLEEILRQMREEEQERVLADLQHRCEKMLQMQEIVYDNTKKIDERVQATPDKKPAREEEIAARRQSDKEDEIVMEADKAIALLEAEGSSVAFPEVFHQVRNDMAHVSRRLAKSNVGTETQAIEEDIIASLKEMIEALKQQQQNMRDKKNAPPPPPGEPGPQGLIDRIAELKMIKALQVRVYKRTELWGKRYQGEQAAVPDIVTELKDLATRQLRIYQVTDNIVKGRNR